MKQEDVNILHFSTGVQLDNFGHLHGVYRIVETDIEYRLRIIEKIKNGNCLEITETKDKRIKEIELMLFDSDLHLEAAIEEINRLKAILKDVKLTAEWHIEDCACSHPMSKYQLGWFEAMNLIKEKVNA